jgi:hypothetical protein
VESDYNQARERASAGQEPFVRVHLAGQEPVILGFVETRKGTSEIWIRFEAESTPLEDGNDTIPPDCYWVHVPESAILGIEIAYRRSSGVRRPPIGFTLVDE